MGSPLHYRSSQSPWMILTLQVVTVTLDDIEKKLLIRHLRRSLQCGKARGIASQEDIPPLEPLSDFFQRIKFRSNANHLTITIKLFTGYS